MFIYKFNEKGLKKFEKDINERIQEADNVCITLENKDTQMSVGFTKEEINDFKPKVNVTYNETGYTYIDFDLNKLFLGNLTTNDDVLEIVYYYDNYDSIEHFHQIKLRHSNIIFEYYNALDETIVKEYMED